jgi:hypothetical protein
MGQDGNRSWLIWGERAEIAGRLARAYAGAIACGRSCAQHAETRRQRVSDRRSQALDAALIGDGERVGDIVARISRSWTDLGEREGHSAPRDLRDYSNRVKRREDGPDDYRGERQCYWLRERLLM